MYCNWSVLFSGSINISTERSTLSITNETRLPSNINTLSRPTGVDSSSWRLRKPADDVTETLAVDSVLSSPTYRRRGTRSMVSTLAAVVQSRPSITPIAASLVAAPTSGAILFPVTFRTPESCAMTKLKIYSTFSIHMKVSLVPHSRLRSCYCLPSSPFQHHNGIEFMAQFAQCRVRKVCALVNLPTNGLATRWCNQDESSISTRNSL